jgi:hypothetical protein
LAEQLAVNQWVRGSNPCWGANPNKHYPDKATYRDFLFFAKIMWFLMWFSAEDSYFWLTNYNIQTKGLKIPVSTVQFCPWHHKKKDK